MLIKLPYFPVSVGSSFFLGVAYTVQNTWQAWQLSKVCHVKWLRRGDVHPERSGSSFFLGVADSVRGIWGNFEKIVYRLSMFKGMGYERVPSEGFGGWGCADTPAELAFRLQIWHKRVMQHTVCCLTEEYIMYTVSILWGNNPFVHTAWTLASAKEWLTKYPNKDVFGTVTDCLGRTVVVKYYR